MRYNEVRELLSKARVGIAGAGGLGSTCAIALARSGVGTLVIIDFDRVEKANLNRQQYFSDQTGTLKTVALKENILRIDPDIMVVTYEEELTPENTREVFKDCDVIIEAFDHAGMKEMIIRNVQQHFPDIPLIVGSGVAGWGQCDTLRCRKIDESLYVCGDETTEANDENPPIAPRVGIVANMQANIVLEILLNKYLKSKA